MMRQKITLLFLNLALAAPAGFSQGPVTASIRADLDRYRAQRMQEKLYVHTDKDLYLAGEICWFKVYAVDAGAHRPLDMSKVAYLEWLDKDNKPVLQAKTGLDSGSGDGSLYLPLTVRTGNYKLRAYTSWMKNYGPEGYFEKTITIINTRKDAGVSAAPVAPRYSVSFFPEGGNLVEELPVRMAFRVTDQYGRGVECTGIVTEDEQDTLAHANPLHFGIGSFVYTPRAGHHYRSIFRLPDGTAFNSLLPVAEKAGTVMTVTPDGNHWRVELRSTTASGAVYLLADTRQSVKEALTANLQDGKAGFLVDRDSLGEGVSHLTVFDASRQPVCERLVFRQPSRQLHITVAADKAGYGMREKIGLSLSTENGAGRPVAADCSLSVYLADSLQPVSDQHILPWLLLASDLKGRIESPGYYFDHPEDEAAMDNLLMTHGWRRFRWADVLRHTEPAFQYPPEFNGSIISGRMVDAKTGGPAQKMIQAYCSVPGTRTQFSVARSDDYGHVQFEMKDLYGSQELILQTNPADSQYRVEINNPFSEEYTKDPLDPYVMPQGLSATLTDRNIATQVLNRYGGLRLKQFHVPIADTSAFFYRPDYSYLLDNYVRFTTMEEVLREYVTMIYVRRRNGHWHLPVFNLSYPTTVFENDPLILLDGVPVFNIDQLMALDPLKLRKLETVQRRYFLGGSNFEGVMNWTSYKGDLAGYILDPRAVVVDYAGLELQREFYSPSYATPGDAGSHLPDFRNVLYWTPSAATDAKGKKPFTFYSSDIPGKYIIVAEGLTADGTAGTGVAHFEVK
ncbi:MAG TPA: hypothetical protein VHE34_15030 [Puia sp.]|uniref:hypothetical protein n=1 Tax=Puia sp. TaxID=2045100 RepID=UPI002CE31898|nr:hypothetical protein [Puia sp.]HVU96540.1 hypothetical protein [Puia sp.]